jgi:hypothetical protein
MSNSGHGHDRMLREWKIWRDKVRLLKSTAAHSAHNSSVKGGVAPRGSNMKSVFISYSWDDDQHCEWVRKLAERLRADGVDVSIDRWVAVPGDQLPAFMERAIRENGFVVIVCTPRYKSRSDSREGGVGYEGDIMTSEVVRVRPLHKRSRIYAATRTCELGSAVLDTVRRDSEVSAAIP